MKVSIVILEYHSLDEVQKCCRTLPDVFGCEVEMIASSNSCYSPEVQEKIKRHFPALRWHFNEKNGGFAYGMNQGLKIATGDYLVIANSDCVFTHSLDPLLEFMQSHPEVGAIAPRIVDEKGILQDTARSYVSVQSFVARQVRRVLSGKKSIVNPFRNYNCVQTVDWIIGAFIMASRKVYEITGGLSEDYFMYAEDLDWCTRIRESGYEVVYYPKVQIQYKGTRSARKNIKNARVFFKSHLIYWKKFGFFFGYPKRKRTVY